MSANKRKPPTPEYRSWSSMKTRCYNKNTEQYSEYGGRGISICERWRNSFEYFLEDMGERPSLKHTLDRYPDMNGNYEPGNCRWATWQEQIRNRRNSVTLEIDGVKRPMPEWCEIYKINWFTIRDRLKKGMSPKEAFETTVGVKTETLYLTYNGQTKSSYEWSVELGVKKGKILSRKRRGWSDEETLSLNSIPTGCKKKYLYKTI